MKKRFLWVGVACLMAMSCFAAFAGCGSDNGGVGEDGKVTIRFWGWGDLAEEQNYRKLVNQFMQENDDVTVLYTRTDSASYMTTLRASSRNLPEIFYMPDYDFLEWVAQGTLKDISSYVTEEELSTVWPQAVDEYYFNPATAQLGKSEGAKLYGLPKDLGPFTLVYNQDLLDRQIAANGLDKDTVYSTYLDPSKPMTWEQFRTLLKSLKPGLKDGQYGISHYEIETAVYSNNSNFFNEDASEQWITTDRFVEALQFIADLTLVDGVMTPSTFQAQTDGFTRYTNGNCIFSFMGPWDCAQFWSIVGNKFHSNILPVPYNGANPEAKSTAWVGSMGYCISNKASKAQTEAAMRLAKYLCYNESAQRKFYELGQQVPNIVEMAEDEYVNDTQGLLEGKDPQNRSVWLDTINGFSATDKIGGKVRLRYYTFESEWYSDFLDYIDNQGFWTGQKTAKQVCEAYAPTFQAALAAMRAQIGG